MDEKEFPSSDDESDADFVPKEEEDDSDTGSEVSDYETSEGKNNSSKNRKRKKGSKKGCKKAKTRKSEEKNDEILEERLEVNVDALWADFKKDVNSVEIKKTAKSSYSSSGLETKNSNNTPSDSSAETKTFNAKSKSTFGIPNKNKVGGLSNVLNQIRKADKMSTLQKSKLDWNNFKKNEGIEEEIKMHNRGKDGYLEKQDFLQRTDLRQFEIEKDLRTARRKF